MESLKPLPDSVAIIRGVGQWVKSAVYPWKPKLVTSFCNKTYISKWKHAAVF